MSSTASDVVSINLSIKIHERACTSSKWLILDPKFVRKCSKFHQLTWVQSQTELQATGGIAFRRINNWFMRKGLCVSNLHMHMSNVREQTCFNAEYQTCEIKVYETSRYKCMRPWAASVWGRRIKCARSNTYEGLKWRFWCMPISNTFDMCIWRFKNRDVLRSLEAGGREDPRSIRWWKRA